MFHTWAIGFEASRVRPWFHISFFANTGLDLGSANPNYFDLLKFHLCELSTHCPGFVIELLVEWELGYAFILVCQRTMDCGDRNIPAPSHGHVDGVQKVRPLHGRTTGPTRRSTKGQWTPEEDDILRKAVQRFKGKNWKKIAECFKDRTDVQCLHRWQKVLNPELVKGPWSKEEDEVIIELVNKYGPKKWSSIAQHLPGRIGKQCRERLLACHHELPFAIIMLSTFITLPLGPCLSCKFWCANLLVPLSPPCSCLHCSTWFLELDVRQTRVRADLVDPLFFDDFFSLKNYVPLWFPTSSIVVSLFQQPFILFWYCSVLSPLNSLHSCQLPLQKHYVLLIGIFPTMLLSSKLSCVLKLYFNSITLFFMHCLLSAGCTVGLIPLSSFKICAHLPVLAHHLTSCSKGFKDLGFSSHYSAQSRPFSACPKSSPNRTILHAELCHLHLQPWFGPWDLDVFTYEAFNSAIMAIVTSRLESTLAFIFLTLQWQSHPLSFWEGIASSSLLLASMGKNH
ncbi:hypothetical protein VNO77_30574 [Canavalia gladiata]|uniref:Uncharacterized protein n=1 Tax=Canavalia gladiata TaxID=3824 RepID=A0AAN9Q3B3_CANGL